VARPAGDGTAIADNSIRRPVQLHQHVALLEVRLRIVRAHASSLGAMRRRFLEPSGSMASRGHAHVQLGHRTVDAACTADPGESFVDAAGADRQVAETMKRDDIVRVAGERLVVKALGLRDVTGLGVSVAHVPQLAREALGQPTGLTGLAGGASLFPVHSPAAFVSWNVAHSYHTGSGSHGPPKMRAPERCSSPVLEVSAE